MNADERECSSSVPSVHLVKVTPLFSHGIRFLSAGKKFRAKFS
jgi:hypothetical protein